MAITVRSQTSVGVPKPAIGVSIRKPGGPVADAAAATTAGLTLPLKPERSVAGLEDAYILIHGEKKIGKTTMAMVEPNTFLLTFDPLQKFLDNVMQRHVPDWKTFMGFLTLLEQAAAKKEYPYKRVVVDGVDIWIRVCQTFLERKLVVEHIGEDGLWGKGYDMLTYEFSRAVDRIMALPGGVWFISHSNWKEIETRGTRKIIKLLPLMKARAEEILVGRVDGWFAYDYWENRRVLVVRGDERTGAGNRMKGHFLTPDGRKVVEVPMGDSEESAYANLQAAFANKQTFITIAEQEKRAERIDLRPAYVKYLPQAGKKPGGARK